MHLTYRPAEIRDVEPCIGLLPDAFRCDPLLRAAMPGVWRRWLTNNVMQMAVVEDGSEPYPARIVGFGNSVFVTDSFACEARTSLPPHLSADVICRWQEGRSPILNWDALRAANSTSGLNLLILHIGWANTLSPDAIRWVKGKLLEAMLFFYRGYQLKEVIQEIYSEEEYRRGLAAGARIQNDYGEWYRNHPAAPPDERPYLIGGCRGEVEDGSYLSPLFLHEPAQFFLRPAEQELLQLALLDKTDAEIARALTISVSTVHKRWSSIFEQVVQRAPEVLPSGGTQPEQKRGLEKRHSLLSYLRHHPEELRPISPHGAS